MGSGILLLLLHLDVSLMCIYFLVSQRVSRLQMDTNMGKSFVGGTKLLAEVEMIHVVLPVMCTRTVDFDIRVGEGWGRRGELVPSAGKHLRLQRRRQEVVLDVFCVDGGGGGRRRRTSCPLSHPRRCRVHSLGREAVQRALHLLLHLVRPVNEVALQLPSLLHHPLLTLPEPAQQVQPLVDLAEGGAARRAGRRASGLWPVWRRLTRHVELKVLGAEV